MIASLTARHPWATQFRLIQDKSPVEFSDFEERIRALDSQIAPGAKCCFVAASARDVCTSLLFTLATGRSCALLRESQPLKEEFLQSIGIQALGRGDEVQTLSPEEGEASGEVGIFTSGTTGEPKLVWHRLESLVSSVKPSTKEEHRAAAWLQTYEAGSFASLQVILYAMVSGATLVDFQHDRPNAMAEALYTGGASHISGTPTFWRKMLSLGALHPAGQEKVIQITAGGEASDQALLTALRERFPNSRLRHIYATTETGVVFSVGDDREGFPAEWLQTPPMGTPMRVEEGVLQIGRTQNGETTWWDTGDLVEVTADRVLFQGRRDNQVNIGGVKIQPEEIEAAALNLPGVVDALAYGMQNPITGQVLVLDIVTDKTEKAEAAEIKNSVKKHLMETMPRTKVPAMIRTVESLALKNGKKAR